MSTTPTGRPTPAGIEWATAGPDRWEWRGYVVERAPVWPSGYAFYLRLRDETFSCIAPETLEESQAICEEHYQKNQTTTS